MPTILAETRPAHSARHSPECDQCSSSQPASSIAALSVVPFVASVCSLPSSFLISNAHSQPRGLHRDSDGGILAARSWERRCRRGGGKRVSSTNRVTHRCRRCVAFTAEPLLPDQSRHHAHATGCCHRRTPQCSTMPSEDHATADEDAGASDAHSGCASIRRAFERSGCVVVDEIALRAGLFVVVVAACG